MCREITEDIHGIDKRLALLDRDKESTDNALATVGVRLDALEKIGGPPRETRPAVPSKPESKGKGKGKAAAWVGSAIAAIATAIVSYFKAKS